jgi:hypothetical protein
MTTQTINVWNPTLRQWLQAPFPDFWSLGKCIIYCEHKRLEGIECYVEGDLIGELAAKAGISRASAEIEYERPEWAA